MILEIWNTTDSISCHFGSAFALVPTNPENTNFENINKKFGEIIILHISTNNYDHMMHGS